MAVGLATLLPSRGELPHPRILVELPEPKASTADAISRQTHVPPEQARMALGTMRQPRDFASNAKQLWLQVSGALLVIAGRPITCPGMLERALTEVYVLGMNGYTDLSPQGVRNEADVDPEITQGDEDGGWAWDIEEEEGEVLHDIFKRSEFFIGQVGPNKGRMQQMAWVESNPSWNRGFETLTAPLIGRNDGLTKIRLNNKLLLYRRRVWSTSKLV
ncbi:unnamed protein product [Durusdinium trenchii]|uniref:Uncharacterized protein n=1 Tax=Durusdinium trenchii TaxID=1381693 RepID=A0ABP0L0S2_9DINO